MPYFKRIKYRKGKNTDTNPFDNRGESVINHRPRGEGGDFLFFHLLKYDFAGAILTAPEVCIIQKALPHYSPIIQTR